MKKYASSVTTQPRLDYGCDLIEGLNAFVETKVLAGPLEAANRDLAAAYQARQARREPSIRARAALRITEYLTDRLVRRFSRAVEIVEGGRRGPLHSTLFPDGLTSVVSPTGARQVLPTRALLDRLNNTLPAGAESLRTQWLPALEAGLTKLQDAANAHAAAANEYRAAFQKELALRKEHERIVDRLIGQVRGTFPQDRAAQDAVFPTNAVRRAGDEDGIDSQTLPLAASPPASSTTAVPPT